MRLCLSPFQFGVGKMNRTTSCTVELHINTRNGMAMEVCRAVSPYSLLSAKDGYPTRCVYDKTFYCDAYEEEFLGYCFTVKESKKEYSRRACGKKYKLHTVEDRKEIKWITAFFSETHPEVWIGNMGNNAKFLRPIEERRLRFHDYKMNPRKSPVKLRLQKGGLDGIKIGTAIYGDKRELVPYLCSRQAGLYFETMKEGDKQQGTLLEELKLPHQFVIEKDGYRRPYMYFGTVHAVEGTEFDAKVTDLNKFCDILPDGYAVSQEDFESEAEFRKVVRNFSLIVPVRVPARRDPRNTNKANTDCKPEKDLRPYAKSFYHAREDGKAVEVPYEFWTKGYPKNMCADKARTTVVLGKDGYLDVPAIARLPVICAFGTSLRTPTLDRRTSDKFEEIISDSANVMILAFMEKVINSVDRVRSGAIILSHRPVINLHFGEHSSHALREWMNQNRNYLHGTTKVAYSLHLARNAFAGEHASQKFVILLSDGGRDTGNCKEVCAAPQPGPIFPVPPPPIFGPQVIGPFVTGISVISTPTRTSVHHFGPSGSIVLPAPIIPPPPIIPFPSFPTFPGFPGGCTNKHFPCDQDMLRFDQKEEARQVRLAGIRIIYVVVGVEHSTFERHLKGKVHDMAGGSHNVIFAGGFDKLDKDILRSTVETVCNRIQ
ncbi:hypothetical protein GCK32_010759 [Trichostrongylus colubriformis]|uniref:VWFA domain-containing protein n=1 Tax=Trichostrongylus colubriformis TaxID=6319 RepID=A0AAN8J3N2_TRICO